MVGFLPRRRVEQVTRRGVLSGPSLWCRVKGLRSLSSPALTTVLPTLVASVPRQALQPPPWARGRLSGRKPVQADVFPVSGSCLVSPRQDPRKRLTATLPYQQS